MEEFGEVEEGEIQIELLALSYVNVTVDLTTASVPG